MGGRRSEDGWETYQHRDHEIAWLNLLTFQLSRGRHYTHASLSTRETLSLGNVGVQCSVVALLCKGLNFGPDGRVLGLEEELHDLVELGTD